MRNHTRKILAEILTAAMAVTLVPGTASASIIGMVTKPADVQTEAPAAAAVLESAVEGICPAEAGAQGILTILPGTYTVKVQAQPGEVALDAAGLTIEASGDAEAVTELKDRLYYVSKEAIAEGSCAADAAAAVTHLVLTAAGDGTTVLQLFAGEQELNPGEGVLLLIIKSAENESAAPESVPAAAETTGEPVAAETEPVPESVPGTTIEAPENTPVETIEEPGTTADETTGEPVAEVPAEVETEDAPETGTETAPESVPATTIEAPENTPVAAIEEPETTADETTGEPVAEVPAEAETEEITETEPVTEAEPEETEAVTEAETEELATEAESATELVTDIEVETELETEAEPETEAVTEAETEELATEAEPATELVTDIEVETELETEAEPETEAVTEAATENETGTEAVSETEPITEAASEEPTAEAEPEAEPVTEAAAAAEPETESEAETELPEEYKTELVFENEEVVITVTATEEAQLPMDTRLVAEKLAEDSEEYLEAKAAADAASGADPTETSYSFYSVRLVSGGQALNPASGTVSVQMTFKNIKPEENFEQSVFHIEDTENGKVAENITDTTSTGDSLESMNVEI